LQNPAPPTSSVLIFDNEEVAVRKLVNEIVVHLLAKFVYDGGSYVLGETSTVALAQPALTALIVGAVAFAAMALFLGFLAGAIAGYIYRGSMKTRTGRR
jgi:hypothetical protein